MFIDYRQEQWPDWLGMARFVYNNKVHLSMKTSSFKANYRQDPRMGFKMRKKKRYEGAKKFVIVTVVLWTSSHILYGLPLYQKSDISKATC